jgi:diguanylate cyclase (GGDEF)-like protein
MTGFYNRNAYDYFIYNEKNIKNYMVVTFDLNNLKMCNDNYGHSSGDAYIIHSAHIIETTFDRFGKCYRIGGDEFCCLIPDAAEFQIERFIQKMQQDIAILNNKNIIPTEVGIACGYALATPDDADIEKVRERADEMMYHNKKVLKGLI